MDRISLPSRSTSEPEVPRSRFWLCTADGAFPAAFQEAFQLWRTMTCAQAELLWVPPGQVPEGLAQRDILFLDLDGLEESPLRLQALASGMGALYLCASDPARAIDCYALHPADFLPKPVRPAALERALGRCIPLWQDCLLWLELGRIQVPLCELAWAEASGHNCLLHCVHGVIRASESLSSLERRLPPFPFVRCQRSFLVNLRHVRAMGEGGFRMSGGGEVPIGQSSRAGAVQAYQAFRRRLEGAEKP